MSRSVIRAPFATPVARAAARPAQGVNLSNVIPLASGRKEGVSQRPLFAPPPAKRSVIEGHIGLVMFVVGAAMSLAGALAMVFTSLGPALAILGWLALTLSGNRLLSPTD